MGELIRRRGSAQKQTEQWLVPSTSDNGGGSNVFFYSGDSLITFKTYANSVIQRSEWLAQKDGKMSAVFYNSTENAVNIGTLYAGSVYPSITNGSFGGTNHGNANIVVSDTSSYATGSVPAGGSLKVRNIAYKDGTFPCVWRPANLTCELYGDIDEYFLPSVSDYVFTGTNTQNKRVTFYSDDGTTVLGYTGYYATVNLTDTFTRDRDVDVIVVNTGGNSRDGKGMGLFLPNDIENAYYSTLFQDAIMASSFMRVPIHVPAGYQLGVVYPNMTILAINTGAYPYTSDYPEFTEYGTYELSVVSVVGSGNTNLYIKSGSTSYNYSGGLDRSIPLRVIIEEGAGTILVQYWADNQQRYYDWTTKTFDGFPVRIKRCSGTEASDPLTLFSVDKE